MISSLQQLHQGLIPDSLIWNEFVYTPKWCLDVHHGRIF